MNTFFIFTDFSAEAANAARFAAALAGRLNISKIILYHSSALWPAAIPADVPDYRDMVRNSGDIDNKMAALRNELLAYSEGIQIETYSDSRPLTEAAEVPGFQEQADLAVMGATAKGSLEEALFGGRTMTIVNHCAKPLLIIPRNTRFEPIKNILLVCDLKKVMKTIPAQFIKHFTRALGAKLFILNADYKEKHFGTETILEQTDLHRIFENENAEFHYIDTEDTADGILNFAIDHNIQLLITVKKKHGLLGEIFHKSISKKLIFKTDTPLLILKEND